jgi:hypothetical protein
MKAEVYKNGHGKDLDSYLNIPDSMSHNAVTDIRVQRQNESQQARGYKFTFKYKGRVKNIEVWGHMTDSLSEIEERAAEEAEMWMKDMDEMEKKRAPTEDEKKEIGKAMNEFYLNAKKRRESSSGRLYFPGVN